ncbi:TetR/AcrR family transcriptional regulator C-terminal domain-containing protein [Glycomyces salinus]|uniref:TetR/AcrR family transcriptional regulator C-terminal domain-containing protein n=1 Tax=Glycomyces salinus TaxID=980294 RepID=UPI0018ECD196|nr:TetR/AcrR family transcriptional regulator C-terminal domain-containing protein [Glycomyces salinus]
MNQREPLTGARVIEAAAAVADRGGLPALSMRTVGRELGVEAMSLYHHVAGKEALLDGLADWIFTGIELPDRDAPWREGMRRRAVSAREVLSRHPWALTLIESRANPGPALLRHHDAVIGCLRRGGFSAVLASRAFSMIDAYVYGFALTERNLPFEADSGASDFAAEMTAALEGYPDLAWLARELITGGDYSFAAEFDRGLDIILDALDRRLGGEPTGS